MPLSGELSLTSPDGNKIWAESAGEPSKPALVFIHGMGCTALGFDNQFADPDLLHNFHLIRYELRGHGRSGVPVESEGYESIRYAEDFKTVCEAFGVEKPFLIGWSLGGAIAVDVINAYGPTYLSGIIYCGGGAIHLEYGMSTTSAFLVGAFGTLMTESAQEMTAAASFFADSCVAPTSLPISYPLKLQMMGGFLAAPRHAKIQNFSRKQDASAEWERRVRNVPVFVVQGREDQHRNWEAMRALLERLYADLEIYMLDGVGHSPHLESPAETNKAIGTWVGKVLARE
ncbi:alpha/beta-hydrolase [Dichomitus squalens]|uniref:Alpha/beta-hydrolase n=1 Tax=Dichomitus squalens TaxID=114155 RepID=A0A4Q9MA40_9APHY|nr:alpha/beta-hydrolase [Dichomitus squalens]